MFRPGSFLLASYAALSQWILICKGALTNDFSYRILICRARWCNQRFAKFGRNSILGRRSQHAKFELIFPQHIL